MSDDLRPFESDGLLTVGEVARVLRVSDQTVRRLVWRGEIEASRLGSGPSAPVRIRSSELTRFLRASAERQVERREAIA